MVYGEADMPSTIAPLIAQHHAHLLKYGKDYGYRHTDDAVTWQYSNSAVTLSFPIPNLSLHNTATAITALLASPLIITQNHIQAALPKVKLAGRFDSRRMSARQWVFDVAHNEHGMQFLLKQLTPYVHAYQRQHPTAKLHLVISMLADKDIEPVLAQLQQFSQTVMPIDSVHSGVISHPRASSQERLTELLPRYFNSVSIFEDLNLATQSVIDQSQENDLILVCGSFYTISGVLTSQSLSE